MPNPDWSAENRITGHTDPLADRDQMTRFGIALFERNRATIEARVDAATGCKKEALIEALRAAARFEMELAEEVAAGKTARAKAIRAEVSEKVWRELMARAKVKAEIDKLNEEA